MAAKDTRTRIIRIFTFLGGLYFFLYFLLPEVFLKSVGVKDNHEQISNGFIVVGAMAIGLGLINLASVHGSRVAFRRPGWGNSLALLLGLICMMSVSGLAWIDGLEMSNELKRLQIVGQFATVVRDGVNAESAPPFPDRVRALTSAAREQADLITTTLAANPSESSAMNTLSSEVISARDALRDVAARLEARAPSEPDEESKALLTEVSTVSARLAGGYGAYRRALRNATPIKQMNEFLFDGLFTPLGSAMFALLGVYIAAAAYRAFRIRTVESGLMMVAAVIVMLGQISFGAMLYEDLPAVRQWLLEVPSGAAFRAIRIGAAVAGLMLAIRMWLSIESKSFSKERK